MKRALAITAMLALTVAAFAQSWKDGYYFAQEPAFGNTGWKEQVVLQVKGGKIVAAEWNAVNNLGVEDKKTYAAAGKYGIKKVSKIGKEWDEQAAAVERYLVKTQDVGFSKYTNAAGNTDAISGASIHVKEFFDLAKGALAAGPVAKGLYSKDGWYYAAADKFESSGWKDVILVTVVNGTIVDSVYNGLYKDDTKKAKILEAAAGNYGMGKVAKQGEWDIQAKRLDAALVKLQDPAKIAVKADGTTDAVTGVSIHAGGFVAIAMQALKAAR